MNLVFDGLSIIYSTVPGRIPWGHMLPEGARYLVPERTPKRQPLETFAQPRWFFQLITGQVGPSLDHPCKGLAVGTRLDPAPPKVVTLVACVPNQLTRSLEIALVVEGRWWAWTTEVGKVC